MRQLLAVPTLGLLIHLREQFLQVRLPPLHRQLAGEARWKQRLEKPLQVDAGHLNSIAHWAKRLN